MLHVVVSRSLCPLNISELALFFSNLFPNSGLLCFKWGSFQSFYKFRNLPFQVLHFWGFPLEALCSFASITLNTCSKFCFK